MKDKKAIFSELYPNAVDMLATQKEAAVSDYSINDYWNKPIKGNIGDFYDFLRTLIEIFNMNASDTIKKFLKKPKIKLDYDKTNPEYCLYVLGKGVFNNTTYRVRATSEHKYHTHEYIIDVVEY